MARYKPTPEKLETLEDVDSALREIGLLEREIESIDGEAQKQIGVIKAAAAKQGEPLRKKIAELSAKISAFAEYNKGDLFKDKKSVDLTFGVFGFRKSTSISVKKTTVALLEKLHLDKYNRVEKQPDKEIMKDMDDESLAQVDAVRKTKDEFFCKPNREEVNKDLLKHAS
ncbi:MAG: host-nuclease inhibitor Gam family protein [Treponema sp.]|jgi:phage host-nuclease inhibitor protein Gam|nr:host-nuclease inhibitor Gam family protein [Treponema sp.]